MKSFIKVGLLAILIMAFIIVLPGFIEDTNLSQAADDEAEWSEEGSSHFDGYTVLEITPYKGMGELGYLVGGLEPVDAELFSFNSGPGSFSHVQDALQFYRSYEQKELPANGQLESYEWQYARTEVSQNGYFVYAGEGADRYTINEGQTVYQKVAEGSGTHRAILPNNARLERVYQGGYDTFMRQNVNAYFTDTIPADTSELLNTSSTYSPYCVTASRDQTGDYDYDAERNRFFLDKGNGSYDVIFEQDSQGKYYMYSDYEIVTDNSGVYSYTDIQYAPQAGGDYIINNNGMTFTYQRYGGGNYRWVEDNTALTKPNFSRETVGGVQRIWVQGLKFEKRFQYTFRLGIVNNEWLKRNVLGVPSEMANDFPLRVVTLTPAQLNANLNNEQDIIQEAGLIYFHTREHDPLYIQLYEQYSHEGLALPSSSKFHDNNYKKETQLNFAYNDINWEVTDKLFRKIAGIGCKKAGAIFDNSFYHNAVTDDGTNVHTTPYLNYRRNNSGIGVNYSTNIASSINMVKLFIMVFQRNKIDFYNSFMNPDTTVEANRITAMNVATSVSPTGSTGSFIRPNGTYNSTHNYALYWNLNTFIPWGLNSAGEMVQIPEGDAVGYVPEREYSNFIAMGIYRTSFIYWKNYMVDNVLVLKTYEGRPFGERFDWGITVVGQDGTEEEIPTEDWTEKITGGGSGYEDTGGISYPPGGDVEGPPDAPDDEDVPDDPDIIPDDGSTGSNIRKYKRVLNIQPTAYFEKSETDIRGILADYDVQIINMTSTQFNGSLEDINSFYDMIYMGSAIHSDINYNRFNITANNRTNFNNSGNLNRYFYLEYGDTMRLTGAIDVRYRSNDITSQKKSELINFLNAGYPIVLDSYLYTLNAQVGRVMQLTNMYDFVYNNRNNINYRLLNAANSSQPSFINSIKDGFAITRPRITLISPISSDGSPVQAADLNIEFQLYLWEDMPHYLKYNAFLYVDRNADGIFEETDKVTSSSTDGSSWEGIMLSLNTRKYKYNVTNLNGVYQWKLVVERMDNPDIRACITGYVSNTNKETLNILHIRDNSSTYDLRQKSQDDVDSLIYQFAGDGKLFQYNLKFYSITVDDYEGQFTAENPYNSSEMLATGKLSKYHILILDNPTDPIDNTYGAATNIKDEIINNLGLIYTKGALGYDRQKLYYNEDRYSFINHNTTPANYTYTYNYINRNSVSSGYMMIYRNMIGENSTNLRTDAAYTTNYLTKTNEGSITRYPYQIDKAISIADNSYSNDAVIDYDHTLSPKQSLVGWYCLSDTKSPIIREVFGISGTPDTLYRGVYSSSPNDVKNNYYLFSNRTTFYSGINLELADQARKNDEIKLFINTIYAVRKATESRTIIAMPVVDITIPIENSVILRADDLNLDNKYTLVFDLSESLSKMSLNIQFGTSGVSEAWMETVYEFYSGTLGPPIDTSSGKVFESDKTYAILVPREALNETSQLLRITATNETNHSGTDTVGLAYSQPLELDIIDPSTKFAYVDMDYTGLANDQDMLETEDIEIRFSVSQVSLNYTLSLKSGVTILEFGDDKDYTLYTYSGGIRGSESIIPTYSNTSDMDFVLYINMSTMKNINIREFTIVATDSSSQQDSDSFKLLRRSLFPLD